MTISKEKNRPSMHAIVRCYYYQGGKPAPNLWNTINRRPGSGRWQSTLWITASDLTRNQTCMQLSSYPVFLWWELTHYPYKKDRVQCPSTLILQWIRWEMLIFLIFFWVLGFAVRITAGFVQNMLLALCKKHTCKIPL